MHLKQVKIIAEHIFGELDSALVICQSLLQQNKQTKNSVWVCPSKPALLCPEFLFSQFDTRRDRQTYWNRRVAQTALMQTDREELFHHSFQIIRFLLQ